MWCWFLFYVWKVVSAPLAVVYLDVFKLRKASALIRGLTVREIIMKEISGTPTWRATPLG
jgi:hypothetical protein